VPPDLGCLRAATHTCRNPSLISQQNLSQADLGELVDLHYTHISRQACGLSRPSAETLKRLARRLRRLSLGGGDRGGRQGPLRGPPAATPVQELPDRDKEIVKELLDAFLTKRQIQQLAAR
jgi:transcriptional regulator with XRE-family HTH domain